MICREPSSEVIELALKAAKITGLEVAGVDIIYDIEHQQYVVLEVNGIPAFATPDQEQAGLHFNDTKISYLVDLIERTVCKEKTNGLEASIVDLAAIDLASASHVKEETL